MSIFYDDFLWSLKELIFCKSFKSILYMFSNNIKGAIYICMD